MLRIKETELKSIKRATVLPDTYFVSKFGFSPYKGCQHGCAYCDGRAEKYYVEGVFDEDIEARLNAPQTLDTALSKSREFGIVGVSSGVSDAYQPIEGKYKIMPDVIDVLIKHKAPAYIMTKSALALRDIDKWKILNEVAGVTVFVSLTTLDDKIAKIFEPRASLASQRLRMIEVFKAAGIGVVVLSMPFMPRVTDKAEMVEELFSGLSDVGVDAVMPGGMTLRPGCQKDHFFNIIESYDPSLIPFYKNLYHENKMSGAPINTYMVKQAKMVDAIQGKYNLLNLVPHSLYRGRLQIYDEIWVLLDHMVKLYSRRGVDISPLKKSKSAYRDWLEKSKKNFNKNRKITGHELDASFQFLIQTGEFDAIIQNEKLSNFLKEVILERKCLNYKTLQLKG
ncbi:radical SAM protein [Fusibacter sp. JL216-2]|uniref:SPL family radical SAM protein n=1 Tax=Fusibacter sp. JL216-2 TaxID=3071453 RepID=UPI003D3269F2